jgi:hypothetical protein
MAKTAIIFCLLLISVSGAVIAYNGGFKSVTVFIPAIFGGLIGLMGLLAMNEGLRKHAMHLAAMIGLLGGVGCLGMGVKLLSQMGSENPPTIDRYGSVLTTAILCLVFVGLCVRSFIQARKNRESLANANR